MSYPFRPNEIKYLNDSVIEIFLNKGFSTLINVWQYDKVKHFKWYVFKDGLTYYARTSKRNEDKIEIYLMHRLITDAPKNFKVDHADRNGLNNLDENLRLCNSFQNKQNEIGKGNKSGYKDIFINENKPKKYMVRIVANGIRHPAKSFALLDDAIKYRDELLKKLHGEFARFE